MKDSLLGDQNAVIKPNNRNNGNSNPNQDKRLSIETTEFDPHTATIAVASFQRQPDYQ